MDINLSSYPDRTRRDEDGNRTNGQLEWAWVLTGDWAQYHREELLWALAEAKCNVNSSIEMVIRVFSASKMRVIKPSSGHKQTKTMTVYVVNLDLQTLSCCVCDTDGDQICRRRISPVVGLKSYKFCDARELVPWQRKIVYDYYDLLYLTVLAVVIPTRDRDKETKK